MGGSEGSEDAGEHWEEFVLKGGGADEQMQLYYTSKVLQIWHKVSLEQVYGLTSEDLLVFTALKYGFKIIRRILVRSQATLVLLPFYGTAEPLLLLSMVMIQLISRI